VDALLNPGRKIDLWHIPKFLASQAIQFALPGVPASYIHSVLGSRNWKTGLRQTRRARTINREKLQVNEVLLQLKDPEAFRSKIFYNYIKMIKTRKRQSAFHPNADFEILKIDPKAFVIARYAENQIIYAVTNISSKQIEVSLSGERAPLWLKDLITGVSFRTDALKLTPYQFLWLSTTDR
jgi:sucrose phosphorylase